MESNHRSAQSILLSSNPSAPLTANGSVNGDINESNSSGGGGGGNQQPFMRHLSATSPDGISLDNSEGTICTRSLPFKFDLNYPLVFVCC